MNLMEQLMTSPLRFPDEETAASVVTAMTREKVLSAVRMTTGEQYFVFDIKTVDSEYVIRMTDMQRKNNFISGMYWQEKLIPLGVPLAQFIQSDLQGNYSPFPSLLMMRLPGTDLCNIYASLTDSDKKNLAREMVNIQSLTNHLPDGPGYGITASYEQIPKDQSWYDFLMNRLLLFKDIIEKNAIYDEHYVNKVIAIAQSMENEFRSIRPRPFLWDASERNVIIDKGKITGIVDVDDICFGDPLLVIALTAVALEHDGYDTAYTDYWAQALQLDLAEQRRLEFYKLFYVIVFMRKHSMTTSNAKKVVFNSQKLQSIFHKFIF